MKLIGVLGGTSWPSTTLPYRLLNEDVQRRLGGHHSARIALYSIDYNAIKSRYDGGWDEIPSLLRREIDVLMSFGPDCWMIANNTLHKAYDQLGLDVGTAVPFFHAVHLVRDHLIGRDLRRVLLIGTKFTMEDGFYAAPLEAAGLAVRVPDLPDREAIQAIQTRLSKGEMDASFRPVFADLLARYEAGCDAVVTACTELPLVVDDRSTSMAVIDPLVLQCRACVDFALA